MSPAVELTLDEIHAEQERRARGEELAEEAARLSGSLAEYIRAAWHVVEPATPFVPNWHIDLLAEHMEAAYRREITRLLINIQPRVMKSLLTSVLAPTWRWTNAPHERFLTASYAQPLATRDALKSRRLITSAWYRARWGDVFQLTGDQNQKTRYENDRTGYRIATSVGGAATGEGGDVLIVDDPHKLEDAHSAAALLEVRNWWGGAWSTRLNNLKTGVKIVIQQRIHEGDLTGHILAGEEEVEEDDQEWTHICLPAEYEPKHPFVWPDDPRGELAELLWPERVPRDALESLKREMGSFVAAGQLQQRPAPAEGGILKRAWWRYFNLDRPPAFQLIIQSWDTALKEKATSDFVVGQVWGVDLANRFLLRQARGQWGLVETIEQVRVLNRWVLERFGKAAHVVLIENTANGPEVIAALRNEIAGILPIVVDGDKVRRAHAASPQIESGNVYVPGVALADGSGPDPAQTPAWVQSFVDVCSTFPFGAHDDEIDAMTQALIWMRNRGASETGGRGETPDTRAHSAGVRDTRF